MHTILVPTDFSATSKNASRYAIDLAIAIGISKIVFYHFYETVLVYTPTGKLDEEATVGPAKEKSIEELEEFIESLGTIPDSIEVDTFHGASSVSDGIVEVLELTNANLIVMGITPGGIVKETFIGNHSLTIAKKVKVPVLIIPPTAHFDHFENITFLSDFKEGEKYLPVEKIKGFLSHAHPKFTILHLLSHNETTADNHPAKSKLEQQFKEFNPVFNFVKSEHYTDDIIDYTLVNHVDILIVVPKFHSLIDAIFNDHTKKLATHSKIPLLIAHN